LYGKEDVVEEENADIEMDVPQDKIAEKVSMEKTAQSQTEWMEKNMG
jgi:hypothetical protein